MRQRRLLYRRDGEPRLFLPALAVLALTIGVGLAVVAVARRSPTEDERAATLSRSGRYAAAESIYVRLLAREPTVPRLIAFVGNHDRGVIEQAKRRAPGDERAAVHETSDDVMPAAAVEALLGGLPPGLSMVARFVRAQDRQVGPDPDVREAMEAGAKETPPTPWYNHLLAEDAARSGNLSAAAEYFEREGLAFPERSADVGEALDLWMSTDDWDRVRDRMGDPRVLSAIHAETRARFAIHEHDLWGAVKWTALGYRERLAAWSLAMSGVSALAWGFFCFRLGKFGEHPRRRFFFYVAAFVLGVLSVAPTLFLITIEETKLNLVETGDAARDILFFVFGVGLREEASKLLLFAALLPALRKWGDKLDVLVCGALVGMGFASEENLGYLAGGDLHVGLGRFLTANFFHMALTGTLAAALDDFVTDTERHASDFSRVALMIVGLHGAYDFLISHEEYGGSYMAMVVFVFLTRLFLAAIESSRGRVDRRLSLLHAFVLAAAVVTGVSAVHAATAVGPMHAAMVMAEGLLGEAIILIVFVRSLRTT
jgi:RsiW-degrading membrane proteinase PrsW (M82 family)